MLFYHFKVLGSLIAFPSLQFLSRFAPTFDSADPSISDESYKAAAFLISSLDEKRENVRFGTLQDKPHLSICRGAVLVFLPGVHEIETMRKNLEVSICHSRYI
jgi:HrpA-like RNA helicase